MAESHVPAGYNDITTYLVLEDAAAEIEFLKQVFGATVNGLIDAGAGKIRHAELYIGASMLMLADANPEIPPCSAMLHVYVADCDATYARAIAAGAVSLREPADQDYGDRSAGFRSARGVQWWVATRS